MTMNQNARRVIRVTPELSVGDLELILGVEY